MEDQLFYLLARTLKRLDLNAQQLPNTVTKWNEFLSRINRGFYDFEQERYLLERSMEISSKEMLDLNQKFELAQSAAHMGVWIYDKVEGKVLWTKEVYKLFGLNPLQAVPSYQQILLLIHENERNTVDQLVQKAFEQQIGYEVEFRVKNVLTNEYSWVYAIGQVHYKNHSNTNPYLSGIVMDIDKRKQAEKELHDLQEKLLLTARQAGMSEIATSVLHNIGNILNSVKVSLAMMKEFLERKNLNHFSEAIALVKNNALQPNYFSTDEKGKLLPDYLEKFSRSLTEDLQLIKNEIMQLDNNVKHITDIVETQKELSGISAISENFLLSEVIDSALKMCALNNQTGIVVIKNFAQAHRITTDKVKLLQILVNLIKNAKESLHISPTAKKTIQIKVNYDSEKKSYLVFVEDNGVGISQENLTKIFSMGYTTKPSGHGFGLHSCANAAKQLGGSLRAISEGVNKGAVFILQLSENNGDTHGNNT